MRRYSYGTYLIRSGPAEGPRIEAYIVGRKFLQLDEKDRLHTRNRQHRLYAFHLPEIGRDVVLKIYALDPSYPPMRKLEIWASRLFKDRCKGAFDGALALQRAGIATFTPLARWTYRKSWLETERYLLYEKIPAPISVGQYRDRVKGEKSSSQNQALEVLIEGMAEVAAKMHSSHLRHGDLAFGNFLVNIDPSVEAWSAIDSSNCPVLYVIDTDKVSTSRLRHPFLKRVLDLKSLKPINFEPHERKIFLKKYLAADYSPFWLRVFEFWHHGRYRLFRRFKKHWLGRRP